MAPHDLLLTFLGFAAAFGALSGILNQPRCRNGVPREVLEAECERCSYTMMAITDVARQTKATSDEDRRFLAEIVIRQGLDCHDLEDAAEGFRMVPELHASMVAGVVGLPV